MGITVERLGSGRDTLRWLGIVFAEPTNWDALPDECRCNGWVDALHLRAAANEILALAPTVEGEAAGLFWGAPWESGIWSVHQFVMPRFRRGWLAIRLARAAAANAFELLDDAECLVGLTPRAFRASYLTALRAGFEDCGTLPSWHRQRGVALDCAIMTMRRP